jgi:hypothetical protein
MPNALLHRTLPIAFLLALIAAPVRAPAADATADAEVPGIRLEVTELKRDSGGTLTLRMVMINESNQSFGEACDFRADDLPCANIGGVHLIDAGNKKKYPVVRDDQRKCLCSGFNSLPANGKLNLWAKFPAPPDGVEKITVVMPKFMPMDDVPIRK